MTTGLIVAAVVLAAATAFGLLRRRTDGRVRVSARSNSLDSAAGSTAAVVSGLTGSRIGGPLGSRATLLQFSSAFCAPCRATRAVLADVAASTDGVVHIEMDAESQLDLVRELGIMRTPTTLILDRSGRIAGRAAGVPRKHHVFAAIGALDDSVG